jgi:hypothetical protein
LPRVAFGANSVTTEYNDAAAWLTRERGGDNAGEYCHWPVNPAFIAIRRAPALKFSHFTL